MGKVGKVKAEANIGAEAAAAAAAAASEEGDTAGAAAEEAEAETTPSAAGFAAAVGGGGGKDKKNPFGRTKSGNVATLTNRFKSAAGRTAESAEVDKKDHAEQHAVHLSANFVVWPVPIGHRLQQTPAFANTTLTHSCLCRWLLPSPFMDPCVRFAGSS